MLPTSVAARARRRGAAPTGAWGRPWLAHLAALSGVRGVVACRFGRVVARGGGLDAGARRGAEAGDRGASALRQLGRVPGLAIAEDQGHRLAGLHMGNVHVDQLGGGARIAQAPDSDPAAGIAAIGGHRAMQAAAAGLQRR